MGYSHTITVDCETPSGTLSNGKAYSGDGETLLSPVVPDASTDFDIAVAIDISQIQSISLVSDQEVLVQTNNGSSPDDEFTLKAGVMKQWTTDSYEDLFLTADVTVLYVTNASGEDAQLELRIVYDSTP